MADGFQLSFNKFSFEYVFVIQSGAIKLLIPKCIHRFYRQFSRPVHNAHYIIVHLRSNVVVDVHLKQLFSSFAKKSDHGSLRGLCDLSCGPTQEIIGTGPKRFIKAATTMKLYRLVFQSSPTPI